MAVYERGRGFQVKARINGVDYREQFPTRELAVAYELALRQAIKRGQLLPIPVKVAEDVPGKSLGDLLKIADKLHWRGNPRCKAGDSLYRNAELFVE